MVWTNLQWSEYQYCKDNGEHVYVTKAKLCIDLVNINLNVFKWEFSFEPGNSDSLGDHLKQAAIKTGHGWCWRTAEQS